MVHVYQSGPSPTASADGRARVRHHARYSATLISVRKNPFPTRRLQSSANTRESPAHASIARRSSLHVGHRRRPTPTSASHRQGADLPRGHQSRVIRHDSTPISLMRTGRFLRPTVVCHKVSVIRCVTGVSCLMSPEDVSRVKLLNAEQLAAHSLNSLQFILPPRRARLPRRALGTMLLFGVLAGLLVALSEGNIQLHLQAQLLEFSEPIGNVVASRYLSHETNGRLHRAWQAYACVERTSVGTSPPSMSESSSAWVIVPATGATKTLPRPSFRHSSIRTTASCRGSLIPA